MLKQVQHDEICQHDVICHPELVSGSLMANTPFLYSVKQ